jgi:rod shape-determining protein MreC
LIILSLTLFFCDRNLNYFSTLHNKVPFIAVAFNRVINWPTNLIKTVSDNLTSKRALLKDNIFLRSELLATTVKLQRLGFLEQENAQLRSLLSLTKQVKSKFLVAQLLTLVVDGFNKQIFVDKGEINGVYVGQPVIDAYGLFGQIISVGSEVSKILLITDVKSAIPATIVRNGIQTIVVGRGSLDSLELINISETADIKPGDYLVTSGVGHRFPPGYFIGVVKEIKHIPGERFVKVLLTPSSHINSSSNVLLIWTSNTAQLKKQT